jgi:hypothetical protein
LGAEPTGDVKTAHAVVAITDHVFIDIELLQIRWDIAHRKQRRSLDVTNRVFLGLADVNEQDFLATVETFF